MDIRFKSKKLKKELEDEDALKRKRGQRQAKLIQRRLNEMEAAESLAVLRLLPGNRCHEMKGDRKGHFTVDLDHPYRLVFKPDHDPIPQLTDGGVDWQNITCVMILGVEDTHE